MTTTETVPDINTYRTEARRWLAENMERRPPGHASSADGLATEEFLTEKVAKARALQRKLFDGGYAGITWAKEYGGQGLALEYDLAFLEEAEPYDMPDFDTFNSTTFEVCVPVMLEHSSPEFLRTFVPKVLAGELLVCQFFSEPSAGSDLAGVRTRATRDGDQWVINGQKIWSTLAQFADWGMCLARTDWDAPKHRGLTWFAVPCDSAGLTIRPIRQITGSPHFCEDFFDDVAVPDGYRIGEVNNGWTVTQSMLVRERGAARSEDAMNLTGPGDLVPDLVAKARKAGRLSDPVVRQKLARAHTNDYVSRALGFRISQMTAQGDLNTGVAAYGKLFKGVYTPIRARIGVEIAGAGAMTWDPTTPGADATALAYLNGRQISIAAGTNEMQRNGIGERVLGLPREPSFDTSKPFNEVLRDSAHWNGKV